MGFLLQITTKVQKRNKKKKEGGTIFYLNSKLIFLQLLSGAIIVSFHVRSEKLKWKPRRETIRNVRKQKEI